MEVGLVTASQVWGDGVASRVSMACNSLWVPVDPEVYSTYARFRRPVAGCRVEGDVVVEQHSSGAGVGQVRDERPLGQHDRGARVVEDEGQPPGRVRRIER
jgi:hypothetical protein